MQAYATQVGFAGVGLVLLTYFLLASGRLSNDDWRYPVLNLVGTLGIVVSLLYQWNLPGMITQLCWIAISIVGLMRVFRTKVG